jgi:uncharacterized membrane protein (DUF441 family)
MKQFRGVVPLTVSVHVSYKAGSGLAYDECGYETQRSTSTGTIYNTAAAILSLLILKAATL